MFSRFFINRPIFATVLSVLITLSGSLSFFTLPLTQFPFVTPPTVQVDCQYPGASADDVAQSIAAPLEQQVNGAEDMLYMASQSTSDGTYTLTVSFKPGTNLNLAQVRVMNRVNLATPSLPDVVRATGVTVRRRSPEIVLTIMLNSPDDSYDQLYMSNYALTRVRDEMLRVPGISEVVIFGERDYAMRIWLDPDKLAGRNLTAADVVAVLQEQNATVPVGQIGQASSRAGPSFQIPVQTLGRLSTPEQFGSVIVRTEPDGAVVRVRDVARIDLGAKTDEIVNKFNRKPTIGMAVFLDSDANALETADAIKDRVEKLKADLPKGIIAEIGYDTTPFIRESLREVFKTLRDSILLVSVVVLVFLGSWRAALIPLAAVPVAIVGTFGAMAACGYSLNNLTLFGLVLAVGIVVDDAIVVVEAVEHQIAKGFAPKEATARAMELVSGPIIAVGAVLAAVFLPCMFLPGIVGSFFRQFALTIAVSSGISTLNSLTFSPALAAVLLRNRARRRDPLTWLLDHTLGWLFRFFGWGFEWAGRGYVRVIRGLLRWPLVVVLLLIYAGLIGGTVRLFPRLPAGFIPPQDRGFLIASIQLPDSSSAERTQKIMDD
ncbi:MAG TPA: efflux RND transporter permease subunit, partial [Fimbriiglobus sp.]